MKAKLKVSNNCIIEAEGNTQTDVFQQLSSMQEVFSEHECGCCKSSNIRFVARQNDDEDWFYEMKCQNNPCFAVLQFGTRKKPKGHLYPKRKWDALSAGEQERRKEQKDKCSEAGYLPSRGWWKYIPPSS